MRRSVLVRCIQTRAADRNLWTPHQNPAKNMVQVYMLRYFPRRVLKSQVGLHSCPQKGKRMYCYRVGIVKHREYGNADFVVQNGMTISRGSSFQDHGPFHCFHDFGDQSEKIFPVGSCPER